MLLAGCSSLRFKSTDEVRASGEEAFAGGQYEESVTYYDELLRRDEEDRQARLKRGRARDKLGNNLAAKEDYNVVLEQDQEDIRARLYRAELGLRLGNTAEAEADFTALSSRPDLEVVDRAAVSMFLGKIALEKGDYAMAASHSRTAVTAGRGSVDPATQKHVCDAAYNLGAALYSTDSYAESHQAFLTYTKLAPQAGRPVTPEDYFYLGLTAYLTEDFAGAKLYFAKSDPALRQKAATLLDDPGINSKDFR